MDYDRHIQRYNGQSLLWAPSPAREYLRGQCVQQICFYVTDNGLPMAWADAKDWWNHPALTGRFDFITNNPNDANQVPPRGAVLIWNGAMPGSGGAGHIAIMDHTNGPNSFISFDSNWGGKTCHFVQHNYSYLIGWMVPKASTPAPQGGSMTDLGQARIMAFHIGGRNGYDGRPNALNGESDADLKANHIGKDTATELWAWYNSQEGQNFRNGILPKVYAEREAAKKSLAEVTADRDGLIKKYDALKVSTDKQIADLNKQLAAATAQTGGGIDPVTKEDISVIKATVLWIKNLLSSVFNRS